MKKLLPLAIGLILLALLTGGCLPGLYPAPVISTPNLEQTVAAAAGGTAAALQTSIAMNAIAATSTEGALETQIAFNALAARVTELSRPTDTPTPTGTPTETATSTAIPTSTATLTQTPTITPLPASPTPVSTITPLPPTATPVVPPTPTGIPCNWAQFVTDVTVPDGTRFSAGDTFVKTWRLRNIGACAWTPDYALVFTGGNIMSGPAVVSLNTTVSPGRTVDLSVTLKAPANNGSYTGNWELRSPGGLLFGIGSSAAEPFWVKINVGVAPTNEPGTVLNLAANLCKAVWSSTKSDQLGCPGSENFTTGSVYRSNMPVLEGGYQDNEPAIVAIPSDGAGGYIAGSFPAINVKSGYHFRALTGCLDKSPKCNVTMQVNYAAGSGAVKNLSTWTQVSDGKFQEVDIDLSFLAGKSVKLTLVTIDNDDSIDDRSFWLAPKVTAK